VHSGTTLVNIAGFLASLAAIFMIRFFVLFTVLLVGLFTLEILQPAEEYVILPFTSFIADVSVWILQVFDDSVESYGNVIRNSITGFGVRIERGCNGVEAVIILFAAIFSFPAPLKNKIIGFVIGFFAIQVLFCDPGFEPGSDHQSFLPRTVESGCFRVVPPVPVAGPDYP